MLSSILTAYHADPTLFDDMQLPTLEAALSHLDEVTDEPFEPSKDDLVPYILMELAELSVVYPDPETLKTMIGIWSTVQLPTWQALYETLLYKYNPIWNKDGSYTEIRSLERETSETTDRDTTTTGRTDDDLTLSRTRSGSEEVSDDLTLSRTTSGRKETDDTVTVDRDTTSSGTNGSTTGVTGQTSGTTSKSVTESANGTSQHDVTGYDYNNFADSVITQGGVQYNVVGYAPDTQDRTASSHTVTESGTTSGSDSSTTTVSGTSSGTGTEDVETVTDGLEVTSGTESGTDQRSIESSTSGSETGTDQRDIVTTGSGTEDIEKSGELGETETLTRRETGNIGLTTTQQMIREQREVAEFNLYAYITQAFKKQFCVMVY